MVKLKPEKKKNKTTPEQLVVMKYPNLRLRIATLQIKIGSEDI